MAMLQLTLDGIPSVLEPIKPKLNIQKVVLCQQSLESFIEDKEKLTIEEPKELSRKGKWDLLISHLQSTHKVHRSELLEMGLSNNDITYRIGILQKSGFVNKMAHVKKDARAIIYAWRGPEGEIDLKNL